MEQVIYKAKIEKMSKPGEKYSWSFVTIPYKVAQQLSTSKRAFYVRGSIDGFGFENKALLPFGQGNFLFAVDKAMRTSIGKMQGDTVILVLQLDTIAYKFNDDLMLCLADDIDAHQFFNALAPSHQRYFSKWIDAAKTTETQAKRIAICIEALSNKMGYSEMLRAQKVKRDKYI